MVALASGSVPLPDGQSVAVRGLTVADLLRLAGEFPGVGDVLTSEDDIDPMALAAREPGVIGTVCALSTATPEAEAWPAWVQAKAYAKAWTLTFPFGSGAFVRDLTSIGRAEAGSSTAS